MVSSYWTIKCKVLPVLVETAFFLSIQMNGMGVAFYWEQ